MNKYIIALSLIFVVISNYAILYVLAFIAEFFYFILKATRSNGRKRDKFTLFIIYSLVCGFQIVLFLLLVILPSSYSTLTQLILRAFFLLLMYIPFAIDKTTTSHKYETVIIPSITSEHVLAYSELQKIKKVIKKDAIDEIIDNVGQNNSFRYTNKKSLSSEYFQVCENTLSDEKLYIVVSDTGSSASNIISLFTKKPYNHVSISFDKDLKTIVSYNGGEHIYPPGLNKEMIEFFNKKEDSMIGVYSISVTALQKQKMIDYLKQINDEGSAYNLLGLATKHSIKPNIMFCSQFVYSVLLQGGVAYFEANPLDVIPTDFIEKDYMRKLGFEYIIEFNDTL